MNHSPDFCKAPAAIVTWLYTTLPSLAGILFAGPDLKPANVTTGLQRVPVTRFGGAGATQKPFAALLGAGPGKYYFIVDAVEYRWRAGFVSPPPETKLGWVEYPDCQRHYNKWPNDLSQGWEKDGPYYNAYCGDPKYAESDYRPKGPDNEACSQTPSANVPKGRLSAVEGLVSDTRSGFAEAGSLALRFSVASGSYRFARANWVRNSSNSSPSSGCCTPSDTNALR